MFAFFVTIHIIVCVALVLTVLLQAGRGGGLAGAFGGGGTAQTLFGGRGAATFLSKATSLLAIGFMVMSIVLAILSSRGGGGGDEGLLQQRARQRASEAQLPPSTTSFDPAAFDTTRGSSVSDTTGVVPGVLQALPDPSDTPE